MRHLGLRKLFMKNLFRDLTFVVLLMLLLFGLTYCKREATNKSDFTVIYSNDVFGETEPCG